MEGLFLLKNIDLLAFLLSIQYTEIYQYYFRIEANPWSNHEDDYWPEYATRSADIQSLVEVFAGLGFAQCQDSSLEKGYEKVALYEKQDEWMHAALQTPNGRWRSKMGQGPVIEHLSPESLSGGMYGNPTIYMRRARNAQV